ncbi:aminotransferase class V-fold PLP-dependent enzyme [bacterium]|nr:aminotransferase class V-fold PLP-dependent enzyme [bacterium]
MGGIKSNRAGRHFLQIPGPSNVPDRILRAIDRPIIDHRGPEFAEMVLGILERLKLVFKTDGPIVIFPSSGSGAWEAALMNTLAPGDRVLAFETGHFATLWKTMALNLGLRVDWIESDWRYGADPNLVEIKLKEDPRHDIKAVLIVHNETSTGVTSRIGEIRQAMNEAGHPGLLFVDAISSLGCTDYCHDEWAVDVTICGSQKGLMLPPGLSFNALSSKALDAMQTSTFKKSYWDWQPILQEMSKGFFPYTPATGLLYGLDETLNMLLEEGLDSVFARHGRLAAATREAVAAWGLENACANPAEYSNSTTAVLMPDGSDADELRKIILQRFNMSLGTGLGKVKGKVFRIGHLGDFNELMLAGTLCGVEMGLRLADIPHQTGGVEAALSYLVYPE